ncbi:RING finger protein 207 isoform X10 [Marmota marmota marmota]|uniref:RING finger protein 207 isoform X10 n=1 Tax=Marmota marmota marmota TaxID=9994 RepID=UPI0020921C22|nr:RING finger protein 207 isoform X10 [Marmota marmota marmota]
MLAVSLCGCGSLAGHSPQSAGALRLNQRWPPGRRDHVLLQHLRATPVCALPRRDAPGTHVRAPRHCSPRPAQPRRDPEVQESRAHCVDLESAYVQGCERLEQAVLAPSPQAVKALQTATREAIALLQVMVEEVRRSAAEEDAAIHTLFGSMQDKLAERKALLLQAVQSQYDEKDKAFKEQLSHLAALLPTLQVHLVICSSFLSLANKAEFLDLGYELMERLQSIVTGPHRLRPAQSSKIASDHHAEFARCLEPLLLLGPRQAASAANTLAGGAGPKVLMGPRCPSPVRKTPGSPVQKPTLHRSISTKVLLAEGEDTPFTEHCRHYEDSYRGLQAEVQNLKDQVQELHRDLTRHHSLIKAEIMGDILSRSLRLDARIASEYSSAEGMRAIFQEIWEESYQRVANEQEVYEAQLHDLLQLKQENAYLTTITKQITPYVRSIAKVKERLEPRFQLPVDEQSETLQSTYDGSRSSETLARNDPGSAMEKGEKTSESKGNGRALSGVSEDPPLKNRDHLRSKQKNGDDLPTCREQPT